MTSTHSTVLGFTLMFAVGISGCADTPKPVSTMQDEATVSGNSAQVQERAVPMQKSGYMNVPRVKIPRAPYTTARWDYEFLLQYDVLLMPRRCRTATTCSVRASAGGARSAIRAAANAVVCITNKDPSERKAFCDTDHV